MEQRTDDGAVRVEPFAVVRFDALHHVGTLDAADKGSAGPSLEGDGVSVSQHPDDWRHIARLGGAPTWRITRRDGTPIELLDAHRITGTGTELIIEWAVGCGYARRATLWHCPVSDDPADGWFTFDDEADALAEHDDLVDRYGTDAPSLDVAAGVVATDKLRVRTRNPCDPAVVADLLLTVYAPDVAGLDGVWWDDRYAPGELSCPRGVIAPARMAAMTARRCT